MTFTIKIALQPFEVSFEAGSVAEAVSILTEPDNELSKLAALATGTGGGEEEAAGHGEEIAEPKKRGRKPKAAPEAVAPAPIPVPDAAPPPPTPAPVAPPPVVAPPPPTPVAPPPVVAPPTTGPIGQKIIDVVKCIRDKTEGAQDGGAAYLQWLATPAIGIRDGDTVVQRMVNWVASTGAIMHASNDPEKSPTFQDLIDVVSFTSDNTLAKIGSTALDLSKALQIS